MANQPKRYKKFVATAATATLVASAIAPVASASFKDVADNNDHKKNIEAIAELGYMGAGDNFRPSENVTRGQVAIILANWAQDVAGLEVPADYKTVQRFKDVPLTADDKLLQSAALVKDYGIFEGSNGNLNGANPISREHMALVLNKAFEAVNGTSLLDLAGDTSDVTFADEAKINKNYLPVVKALKKLGITAPASFNPSGNVTRGQFATFFIQTNNQDVEAKVASVSAINATSLKVTGTGLKGLKAEDITVEGNKVTDVQSTDGKTATVKLEGPLADNTDVKVTVKVGEETKEFTVKYTLTAQKVAIQSATFDDDTKNQRLTLLVDGVATSADELLTAGYTVSINAWDKDDQLVNDTFFGTAGATTPSTDGRLIDAAITEGDYTVQATIAKGSTVLTSEKVKVTVKNLDNNATAISSYEITNNDAGTTPIVMKSSTLVVGETADFTKVVVGLGASATELGSGFTVKSSDESVISVDETTNQLTALGLGTAKVTITVGKVTKEVTLTVKGEARKAVKVTPASNSMKVIVGSPNATMTVNVTDQYGDPFEGADTDVNITANFPSSVSGLGSTPVDVDTSLDAPNAKGQYELDLSAADTPGQSGTVVFRDDKNKIVGSFSITTTDVDNTTSKKAVITADSESKDNTLNGDLASDDTLTLKVSEYTSQGVYNGDVANLNDYNVKFNGDIIRVNGSDSGNYTEAGGADEFVISIKKEGSTTLQIFDDAGNLIDTRTITVKQGTTKIKSVAWKATPTIDFATTINYENVLDLSPAVAGKDDAVKGITLTSPTVHTIRIAAATNSTTTSGNFVNAGAATAADGDIYIDVDNDGVSSDGDILIGKLKFTVSSNATGTAPWAAGATGDGFVGQDVATGDKGTLVFTITDETTSSTPTVASKGVIVNVK